MLACVLLAIMAFPMVALADENDGNNAGTQSDDPPCIEYRTHIQNIGWLSDWTCDGGMSGTTGRSLRMEALGAHVTGAGSPLSYKAHIENRGWDPVWDNDFNGKSSYIGTVGLGLRMEAVKIKLQLSYDYDIYYQVHAQNFGWMGWAKNGESAGTAGFAYRLEAIRIVLVPKGGPAPGSTANHFVQR